MKVLWLTTTSFLLLLSCSPETPPGPETASAATTGTSAAAETHAGPDLAATMGEMQRQSMKLGYAIQGRNQPLAAFYLHEVEEVLNSLEQIEHHEEMPIAQPARTILRPLLPPLSESIGNSDWDAASTGYASLVHGCNRCHTATEHEFVVVTVPTGPPPFNQSFTPKGR